MQQQQQTYVPTQLPPLRVPEPGEGGGDWEVPDPDVYRLVISEIGEIRNKQFQGKVEPDKFQVRLVFKIAEQDSPFDGVWFKQWVGYSLHEKAFLFTVIDAIRNHEPWSDAEKASVDLNAYLNRPFRGMVKVDDVPARDDPSRILRFAKVTEAMPVKPAKAAANGNGATTPHATTDESPAYDASANPFDVSNEE